MSRLIIWCFENGYELTGGELLRTKEQQTLYFEGLTIIKVNSNIKLVKHDRLSKTMFSKHLKKLAIDLNVFRDGKLLSKKEDFKPIADYWRSLDKMNESGYDWGWDFSHFQRNEK
jgi:hypothetical protein